MRARCQRNLSRHQKIFLQNGLSHKGYSLYATKPFLGRFSERGQCNGGNSAAERAGASSARAIAAMAATNKCLARNNKSGTGTRRLKNSIRNPGYGLYPAGVPTMVRLIPLKCTIQKKTPPQGAWRVAGRISSFGDSEGPRGLSRVGLRRPLEGDQTRPLPRTLDPRAWLKAGCGPHCSVAPSCAPAFIAARTASICELIMSVVLRAAST
jgi:hypothetical protein